MGNFNVVDFTTAIRSGGARTNLMWAKITSPTVGMDNIFSYLCKASNIPGSTITPIEVPYFGRNVKVAGESREFAPLTTTVVNDEDAAIYKAMVKWFEKFNQAKGNVAEASLFNSRANYTATITLEMYKKEGGSTPDQDWVFHNAWPSNMSAIDLNWDSVNTIQEFTIDWQYDYYLHGQASIKKDT